MNLFLLTGQYAENETNVIHFRSISSQVISMKDFLFNIDFIA
jgi:hypothetical protein